LSFVARHGLWSGEQKEAAARLARTVEQQKLETIRLSFPDQHGILRGKTLVAREALASLETGCTITSTMFAKDTAHRTVFPVFTSGGGFGMREMEGAADVLMVPDPVTFRVLPVGALERLAALRCVFRRRQARAVCDPQHLQIRTR
jgi:glutamine synthetase